MNPREDQMNSVRMRFLYHTVYARRRPETWDKCQSRTLRAAKRWMVATHDHTLVISLFRNDRRDDTWGAFMASNSPYRELT